MPDFTSYFLMTPDDAARFARERTALFAPDEPLRYAEIGDGNINYVFRITSGAGGASVVVKQADRLLRSSGRVLSQDRSRIEAEALRLEGQLAPGMVPMVYACDETMAAIVMEDVSAYRSLRRALAENRVYPHLAESLARFLADTLLPTTDLVLDPAEKKRRAQAFTNIEMCAITEDLVLDEPYTDSRGRNILFPGTEDFVRERLYGDEVLHAEAAVLRLRFLSCSQALLHGDLHSGSIFADERGIKVLDPEFAFYGPMGYDIGNVLASFLFARVNKAFTMPGEALAIAALEDMTAGVWDRTRQRLEARWDELVRFPLWRAPDFRKAFLDSVMADAAGYAGTELIRRTVGDAKVPEVTTVTEARLRVPLERTLISLGAALILGRRDFRRGAELTALCRRILGEEAGR